METKFIVHWEGFEPTFSAPFTIICLEDRLGYQCILFYPVELSEQTDSLESCDHLIVNCHYDLTPVRNLVPQEGLEPSTHRLRVCCATNCATGAKENNSFTS